MGLKGETVTAVAQRLLAQHGGLRGLLQMDIAELARVRGLGDAKAVRLKAVLELGRFQPLPGPLVGCHLAQHQPAAGLRHHFS